MHGPIAAGVLTGACPNEEDDMATTPYQDPMVNTLEPTAATPASQEPSRGIE